jgi:hypothetical protein
MRGERELLLRVFDARHPGALERLRLEIRGWHGYAREEWIDEYRVGLVVRPCGVLDPRANITLAARKDEAAS